MFTQDVSQQNALKTCKEVGVTMVTHLYVCVLLNVSLGLIKTNSFNIQFCFFELFLGPAEAKLCFFVIISCLSCFFLVFTVQRNEKHVFHIDVSSFFGVILG